MRLISAADNFNMARQSCFAAEMLIDTEAGKKRADSIQVGDKLWARNEFDPHSPIELREVEEVFIRVAPILNVHVAGQIIRTTAEHPFYVLGKGWLSAALLEIGDLLTTRNGLLVPVDGIADSGEVATVYNWRIAEHHTYFVSATEEGVSIWAHNASRDYGIGNHSELSDSYGRNPARRNGRQVNHLNQDAAYRRFTEGADPDVHGRPIPYGEGAAVPLEGGTATAGTAHNRFHRSLEGFWDQYRAGGGRYGERPTNAEYGDALEDALRAAGFNQRQVYEIGDSARRNRIRYGHEDSDPVPRIPNPFPPAFLG